MMRYHGNYSNEDETVLSDGDDETCVDFLHVWSRGPPHANFRLAWGASATFNVTITMNDELATLLSNQRKDKLSMRVMVGKEENFVRNQLGVRNSFKKCQVVSVFNYSCKCELQVCSVYMTLTVRDRSLLENVSSLKVCEVSISPS